MSISLRAYALDQAAFRAVQGSGDEALLKRLLAEAEDRIAAEDEWLTRLRPDHLPIAEALRDIVAGTLRSGDAAALSYLAAAEYLAQALGERVDGEDLIECSPGVPAAIDAAISAALVCIRRPPQDWPLLADVLARGPLLDIPWVPESPPNGIGALAVSEVRVAAAAAQKMSFDLEDEAGELALAYASWLRRADESSLALLVICD